MKTLIFLSLLTLCTVTMRAQEMPKIESRQLETESMDSIQLLIDRLLSRCDRNFVFYNSKKVSKDRYQFRYKGASAAKPDSVKLIVTVKEKYIGANPKLEIPGKKIFEIDHIWGKFLDLADIWQFFEPGSKENIINKSYNIQCKVKDHYGKERHYKLISDNNRPNEYMWIIKRTW